MSNLNDLLSKVKAVTGPDRRIDAWLAVIANPYEWNWQIRENPDQIEDVGVYTLSAIPAYTASVDSALAFAERVLPGWDYGFENMGEDGCYARVWKHGWSDDTSVHASGATPPLAIIAATLSALISQEPDHDHK